MHRHPLNIPFVATGCVVLLLFAPGCNTGPGSKGFTLFPEGHPLTPTAKAMRWANVGVRETPRELEKQPLPTYIVEPGDVLLVQPADLDSPVRLPADQPVLPDGTINLGKYGHILVVGKTVPEIENLVKETVKAQTPDAGFISVRLVSRQSKVFYVLGEVNAPGAFPLQGRETVLDALMTAGGLTDRASPNNIILARPSHPGDCRTVLPVCYKSIVQLGDTTTNYQLAPGDRIFVPTRSFHEMLTGGHCDKAPCCGPQAPCVLPPQHGASDVLLPSLAGESPGPLSKRSVAPPPAPPQPVFAGTSLLRLRPASVTAAP